MIELSGLTVKDGKTPGGDIEIQLTGLRRRLADQGIALELTDAASEQLADEGFDPEYGARPLKRAIQQELENPLAQRILAGEFSPGDTIRAEIAEGEGVFCKAA